MMEAADTFVESEDAAAQQKTADVLLQDPLDIGEAALQCVAQHQTQQQLAGPMSRLFWVSRALREELACRPNTSLDTQRLKTLLWARHIDVGPFCQALQSGKGLLAGGLVLKALMPQFAFARKQPVGEWRSSDVDVLTTFEHVDAWTALLTAMGFRKACVCQLGASELQRRAPALAQNAMQDLRGRRCPCGRSMDAEPMENEMERHDVTGTHIPGMRVLAFTHPTTPTTKCIDLIFPALHPVVTPGIADEPRNDVVDRTPMDVIASFDLTCCQAWFDGNQLHYVRGQGVELGICTLTRAATQWQQAWDRELAARMWRPQELDLWQDETVDRCHARLQKRIAKYEARGFHYLDEDGMPHLRNLSLRSACRRLLRLAAAKQAGGHH